VGASIRRWMFSVGARRRWCRNLRALPNAGAGMRRYWWVAAAGAVVFAVVLTLVLWPRGRDLPPARARVYSDATACLLTGSSGVGGPQAAPVWSGMEAASVRTSTKVSYLAVSGDDSVANAVPYVNTLIQRRCGLIIAVEPGPVGAVEQRAASFPSVRFAVLGSSSAPGVTVIAASGPESVSAAADRLVASIAYR
jgi:hypothetical protein